MKALAGLSSATLGYWLYKTHLNTDAAPSIIEKQTPNHSAFLHTPYESLYPDIQT